MSDSAESTAGIDSVDPTAGPRNGFSFGCALGCDHTFNGDDLVSVARKAVKHYNRKHTDQLSKSHEPWKVTEAGGQHVHENVYQVERIEKYLTVYDVLESIGGFDDWLANDDRDRVCSECNCVIPTTEKEHRVEDNPDDPFDDSWTCSECREQQEIKRREQENQQITEWSA